MEALKRLAAAFPEPAKDVRLNLTAVLEQSSLTPAQRFGTALAVAYSVKNAELAAAVVEAGGEAMTPELVADAQAAATLMAMNNVWYRFRHMVGKHDYDLAQPRLRMQRLAAPATNKADLELFSLAVSAVNGCQTCIVAHENAAAKAGLSPLNVNDAVRIAAVVTAAATALALPASALPASASGVPSTSAVQP